MPRALRVLAALAVLARSAHAEREATETVVPATEPASPGRRAAAIALAIVPGVLVHGAGSYVLGAPRLTRRLSVMELAGVAAMLAGGLPTGISGGNPYAIPLVPLLTTGTGLFLSSWFTDIWVAAGGPSTHPEPRARAPWSVELGSLYLRDAYRHRMFATAGARMELGPAAVFASGMQHAGGDAREAALGGEVRILGPAADGRYVLDTTRLGVRLAGRYRDDDDDMVDVVTGELEAVARYDHRRIAPELAGTFTDASVGVAFERARYDAGGHDTSTLLLATFAWGMYLGERGEVRIFYDHRRDSLAGGLQAGRAAGFIGSFGGALDLRVWGPWATRAEVEYGSGWVASLAVRYQGGPR